MFVSLQSSVGNYTQIPFENNSKEVINENRNKSYMQMSTIIREKQNSSNVCQLLLQIHFSGALSGKSRSLCVVTQLIYLFIIFYFKGTKTIQQGKRQSFQQMMLENCISTYSRMKLESCLTPYKKPNSKCIKDLNVRAKTIKFIEENMGVGEIFMALDSAVIPWI